MPKGPFLPSEFEPTEWSTAAEKASFGNTLLHFLDADCPRRLFTKRFYTRLSMTFGNIAHYVESVIMRSLGVIRRVDTASNVLLLCIIAVVHGSMLCRIFG
jgi:hypothetical protein